MSFDLLSGSTGNSSFSFGRDKENGPFSPSNGKKAKTPGKLNKSRGNADDGKKLLTPLESMELSIGGGIGAKMQQDSSKSIEAVQRANKKLEEDVALLKYLLRFVPLSEVRWAAEKSLLVARVEELERQNRTLTEHSERERQEHESAERAWTEKNLSLQQQLDSLSASKASDEEEEQKRLKGLRHERNQIKKENDALAKKLERVEEYLRISKELSNSLQREKQQLSDETAEQRRALEQARTAISALEAAKGTLMAQADRERSQLATLTAQLSSHADERQLLERQLFQSLAVAIKLEKMVMGLQVTYTTDTEQLYERARNSRLDMKDWGIFLRDHFDREAESELEASESASHASPNKRHNAARREPLREQRSAKRSKRDAEPHVINRI